MVKKQIQTEQPKNRWIIAVIVLLILGLFSLFAAVIIGLFISTDGIYEEGNVAHIKLTGIITVDSPNALIGARTVRSTEITELIEEANENPDIVAILLDINSPGGGAVASYEIADAVKKSNKTVVALIREVGASGGYWAASATEYIVANPMSVTGSIGVIASYLDFSEFIEDHNVSYERLVSGKYKDMGIPFKELTEDERVILQDNLDLIRLEFVKAVAENRQLAVEEVDEIANGLFYLGIQAKELNLIDKLGGKDEAIAYIEDKHNIEAELVEYKKRKTFADILEELFTGQSFSLGLGLGKGMYDTTAIRT